VLLVHLKDEPNYRITVPGKTQTYLAVGRPILAAVGGDANELVTRAKAGLACEPEDPQGMAEAVRKFQAMSQAELDAMGANGTRFYKQELSFSIAVNKYEQVFKSVGNKKR
jgi:glycosyltransferase involved in cell wall biosynthesis